MSCVNGKPGGLGSEERKRNREGNTEILWGQSRRPAVVSAFWLTNPARLSHSRIILTTARTAT